VDFKTPESGATIPPVPALLAPSSGPLPDPSTPAAEPSVVPEAARDLSTLTPVVPLPVDGATRVNTFVSPSPASPTVAVAVPVSSPRAVQNRLPQFAAAAAPNVGLILVPDAAALLFFIGGGLLLLQRRSSQREV
jgi:hypothetical protein